MRPVNRAFALFLLSLIILMIVFPSVLIPRAHAVAGGLVCIAQPTDASCTGTTATFNGPLTTPSTLLRVPIVINNTDIINGFDITLKVSNVTKLRPFDTDLTGTLMPTN